ncbi:MULTISPECIES: glycosyltransferase family 10 domain-containing protein [Microcystis]|jgi:hypothetical protein|uniref:Fucosyltransferase C-terminal domain-containing protein n=1 Tax=Microcystis aeruginosa Ma_QC_B_20070730_S2 TaxID=2486256 RepID=A0A552DUP5_MICAE|nr:MULTISPECIES: glycosyltransferase family 10 [Microcystis]TRU07666.1 MAG: hypothetical protein EWV60_14785 [Microcystis sp. Msp_OC_L_20101000_S702]TRU25906.1 MAG: hypothetical protein EWV80_08975 [Microcystis aeruginosa Ma_QC_B_20070730_S2]TYT69271.1 hypothetical protein FXO09_21630 [Microcystis aeruginosa KLA2]
MTVVRVIEGSERSRGLIIRQTPNHSGQWGDIKFTFDSVSNPDFVVIINFVPELTVVECSPENIWAIIQEPPVPNYKWFAKGFGKFSRVYTTDMSLKGTKYIHTQPALRWYVDKDYDYLKSCQVPDKTRQLSWITSNKKMFKGHQDRLKFLEKISQVLEIDLWGNGFKRIPDKWDGLAPYKYSLAIENYSGLHYWSEKLADCFLSYTMPIYYGCVNLSDYFPKESFIWIDINKPQEAIEIIQEAIASQQWEKNLEAITHARELILNEYQFFPFFARQIQEINSPRSPATRIEFARINHIDLRYHIQNPAKLIQKLKKSFLSQ